MAGGAHSGRNAHKFPATELDVTVSIRYHGLKATQYFAKFTEKSLVTLRKDILSLKIPHPKSENVVFLTHGCVEFSWFGIEPFGVLHRNLVMKLRPSTPEGSNTLRSILMDLSITSVNLREVASGAPAISRSANPKKRPNPFPSTEQPQTRKKKLVNLSDSWEHQTMQESTLLNQPSNRSLTSTESTPTTAEQFLQAMESSLRPTKLPKLEPTEPTMPPTPPRRLSLAYPPSPRPILALNNKSVPTFSSMPPPPVQVRSFSPPLLHQQNQLPEAQISPPTSHLIAPPLVPSTPLQPPLLHTQPLNPSDKLPVSGTKDTLAALNGPPPKSSDVPKIQNLTRELWDLRRQVTAALARESSIINDLKQLNAAFVPTPSQYGNGENAQVMKQRLQAVGQRLDAERKLRLESEAALSDIKKECKEPFVVPALLDAFITISKLTSRTLAPNSS